MIDRRGLLFMAGSALALGSAEWWKPRTALTLLGPNKLAAILPRAFGNWRIADGGELVVPRTPGSLSGSLYGEQVARNYVHQDGGARIMLLAAHGDSQSDLLQLHRPESCYPAVGFSISNHKVLDVPIGRGALLPSVEMTASAPGRIEDILYWTRLGEFLPTSAGEQRTDRLRTALKGFIADGVLVRISMLRPEAGLSPDFRRLEEFSRALLSAVPTTQRAALIGTAYNRVLG